MESKLAQYSALAQKDKGPAFISLIPEILAQTDPHAISRDIHVLVDTVINHDNVGLVVGRQVLSELVRVLGEGAIKDHDLKKRVIEGILETVQLRIVSYEEQVIASTTFTFRVLTRRRSTVSSSNSPTCSSKRKNGVTQHAY